MKSTLRPNIKLASGFVIPGNFFNVNNQGTSQNTYTPETYAPETYAPETYIPTTKTGKRGKTTFLDPFTKWPRKDAQSKGIKETWGRRFRRKPGRRGAPAAAGKKIYVAR